MEEMDKMWKLLEDFGSRLDLDYPEDLESARVQYNTVSKILSEVLAAKDKILTATGNFLNKFAI
jgi:hypothetical protein